LILLKNPLAIFWPFFECRRCQTNEPEVRAIQQLPADWFAGLQFQCGGERQWDIDKETRHPAFGADHLHLHFEFSLHACFGYSKR